MDLHRRRWRERLQPEKQYLSLVPPRRRQEQYLAQQRQGNLLRPDRGDYVDRHTLGRTEQTRPAHQPLYRLPDESGRPGHTALGYCTRHRALRRQTDHRHTKRSLPFQPGNGHLRTSFQGYQRRQKYRYGGQPLHRQGRNAMGFRYRRGRIFLPLRHRQAHPLCTQSLHSEHSQQQQCQQHHARQQRQPVVLHFRKRARPLPQGEQRLRKLRYAERRPIQRLYLRSIRVVHTKGRLAADYQSGILPV